MPVNIEALKGAASKIERLGQDELKFSAGEADLTIRALKAREELNVEKFGQVAWDEASGDEDRSALADYLDRMRTATLAHVIVQIDDLDLRDTEYIETGETTEDGKPVKKPRHEVMRGVISQWNRHILHLCYLKYAELMMKIELRAGKVIEFDTKDTETEMHRLQTRLDELHKLKGDAETTRDETTRSTQVREAIKGLGEAHEKRVDTLRNANEEVQEAQRQAQPQQTAPPQPEAAPPRQQESYPPMHDPEAVGEQPRMESRPRTRQSAAPQRATAPPRQEQPPPKPVETDAMGIPVPHEGDSMFDPTDGEAAMHAEHTRLLEHRRRMAEQRQAQQAPEGDPPIVAPEDAPPTGRKAPHRDALNTAQAVVTFEDGEEVRARPKGAPGDVQGYRLPTETISDRTRGQGQPKKAPVNAPARGSNNPRFKGPQQP